MRANYTKQLYRDYENLLKRNEELEATICRLRRIEALCNQELKRNSEYEKKLDEKDNEINALKKEIIRLNGLLGLDSNNSSIPTSKTPIHKNKRIPNSRKESNKKIGGQYGHSKSKLSAFCDEDVTEHEEHALERCPECGGELIKLSEETTKDETDYEVVVIRRRHHYPSYQCKNCGKIVCENISPSLKEENQYGAGVKALALLLMNTGNVSVNKVRKMIYGLSEMNINPSEGYIIKLQKTAAKNLSRFLCDLHKRVTGLKLLYWDDTVISIHKERACLRYYGNEQYALYKAHMKKNKEGLDEDNVLKLLSKDAAVMHDHNIVNYNKEYQFNNIECNAHLLRDLEFVAENLPSHTWAKKLRDNIVEANKKRNELIAANITEFSEQYIVEFFKALDLLMLTAAEENSEDSSNYYTDKERQLLKRILEYKDNYFAWMVNFEYPFTNNLSERSLRASKSKMKISGQFQSEAFAQHYAAIKSYIETCHRNGINEYTALRRLCSSRPYTIDEISSKNIDDLHA